MLSLEYTSSVGTRTRQRDDFCVFVSQVQVETLEQGPNFDAAQAALQKLKPKGLWSLLG